MNLIHRPLSSYPKIRRSVKDASVLFLDYDGVIFPPGNREYVENAPAWLTAVEVLTGFLKDNNHVIVVIATSRVYNERLGNLQNIICQLLEISPDRIGGSIGGFPVSRDRYSGKEASVAEWLDRAKELDRYPAKWAFIDDEIFPNTSNLGKDYGGFLIRSQPKYCIDFETEKRLEQWLTSSKS